MAALHDCEFPPLQPGLNVVPCLACVRDRFRSLAVSVDIKELDYLGRARRPSPSIVSYVCFIILLCDRDAVRPSFRVRTIGEVVACSHGISGVDVGRNLITVIVQIEDERAFGVQRQDIFSLDTCHAETVNFLTK